MSKTRITETQAKDLAEILIVRNISLPAAMRELNITEPLDDASNQTLETLVFACVACDTWRAIESLTEGGVCSVCFVQEPDTYEEVYS